MSYQSIKVRFQEPICFIQIYRPEANNAIDEHLSEECYQALSLCEEAITIVVFEGLPEFFCIGADFQEINKMISSGGINEYVSRYNPEPMYNLWLKMATGPYITVSHVRGKVNAGGVGFVAASDIVLADQTAQFSLSELLFGLFPALVFPFLSRRIGFQKAHYMTLMTQPISVQQALTWGLVDAYEAQSESLLRKHLLRLKNVPKTGISRYKQYLSNINDSIFKFKSLAVTSNKDVFTDPSNLERISRFVETGEL